MLKTAKGPANSSPSGECRLTEQEARALIAPMGRELKLALLGYLRQLRAEREPEQPAGGAA